MSDASIYIFLSTIILIVILILFIFLYARRKGLNGFAQLLADIDKKAKEATHELNSLCIPTKRLEDADIDTYKLRYSKLVNQISDLKTHKYFNDGLYRHSSIPLWERQTENIQKRKEENNRIYDAIETLKEEADKVMKVYRTYTSPNHYFAYSEMEDFISSFKEIKNQVKLVFPKYAEFATNENLQK